MKRDLFRPFVVISIAIALLVGGYSFTQVEESIHHQQTELAQERLNSCKFKLYDLAVGTESRLVHSTEGPEHNSREAQVLHGALDVVNTIPSAKECIPVIRSAIKSEHALSPKVERDLVKLATAPTTPASNAPIGRILKTVSVRLRVPELKVPGIKVPGLEVPPIKLP